MVNFWVACWPRQSVTRIVQVKVPAGFPGTLTSGVACRRLGLAAAAA